MKVWIATYVDSGETCDGKPRVLGVYSSKEEAQADVRADIKRWIGDLGDDEVEVSLGRMYARRGACGCEWNIEEAEV